MYSCNAHKESSKGHTCIYPLTYEDMHIAIFISNVLLKIRLLVTTNNRGPKIETPGDGEHGSSCPLAKWGSTSTKKWWLSSPTRNYIHKLWILSLQREIYPWGFAYNPGFFFLPFNTFGCYLCIWLIQKWWFIKFPVLVFNYDHFLHASSDKFDG